jgi:serine protease Do
VNQFRFDSHNNSNLKSMIITALVSGVIGAFLVILAIKFTGLGAALVNPPVENAPQPQPQLQSAAITNNEKAIIDVVDRVGPSVVMITTKAVVEQFDFFSGPELRNVQGLGSGVVFRKDGYILTNNHVVNGLPGMADVVVLLSSGKSYPAKVVGVDSQTDLAVLKINDQNLRVPEWGDSEHVQVGQTAIAIGNPLAENLKNTVTVGVVSAKGRSIKVSEDLQLRNMLQTDASINPGNSGGPLLDNSGKIIGINSAIAANSQGIGFAIPSNMVKIVAEQLISKGYVTRPGLGIVYTPFTPDNVDQVEYQLGRRLPVDSGLLIVKVIRNSPAHLGGLLPGDIITEINGQHIKGIDLIRETISKYRIGTQLKLKYYRGAELRRAAVKIGEMRD